MSTTAPADQSARQKPRRGTPKLRDGVMKRGNTWYYVIRVPDPSTDTSKPKWVGGFDTECCPALKMPTKEVFAMPMW